MVFAFSVTLDIMIYYQSKRFLYIDFRSTPAANSYTTFISVCIPSGLLAKIEISSINPMVPSLPSPLVLS